MLRLVLTVALLCTAALSSESTEWTETDVAPLTAAQLLQGPGIKAVDSPLLLEADNKVSFDGDKYEALKQYLIGLDGDEFVMKHFGDETKLLVLETIQAFAPNGVVRLVNPDGTETVEAPPDTVHVHGHVSGDPSSFVLLNLAPGGSTGVIHTTEGRFSLEDDHTDGGHSVLLNEEDALAQAKHESKDHYATRKVWGSGNDELSITKGPGEEKTTSLAEVATGKYYLSLKIDCDLRCVQLLNQQAGDARKYLAGLIAGTNVIYKRDLGREMQIKEMKLWSTASPYDQGTNSLGDYRRAHTPNSFDLVHLFTGIRQGGVAYVGTVCRGNSGANTGVSSLRGKWTGTQQSSAFNWDLIVTAHEMGHNVGSGHSHDYKPPIDQCVACRPGFSERECLSGGSTQAPVKSTDPRCVRGTVMSYCHLCKGATNIDMKFHPRAIKVIKDNLNKACGQAGPAPPPTGTPTPTPPTPTPPAPTPANCADKYPSWCQRTQKDYPDCDVQVQLSNGQTTHMRNLCPKTCGQCGGGAPTPPPAPPCADTQSWCGNLPTQYCSWRVGNNPVSTVCPKKCGKC